MGKNETISPKSYTELKEILTKEESKAHILGQDVEFENPGEAATERIAHAYGKVNCNALALYSRPLEKLILDLGDYGIHRRENFPENKFTSRHIRKLVKEIAPDYECRVGYLLFATDFELPKRV